MLDENVVHIRSLVRAEDTGKLWESLGGGSSFTLLIEDGNWFCLDVGYTWSLGFVEASSQVSNVRKEDIHVDTIRQPFTVSEELVYN